MNKAVRTGGMILVAWSIYMEPAAWAQSGWPQPPSSNVPVQLTCGDPPPVKEDPSPGDSTECWRYKHSDGWTRLFNCVQVTNCPTAIAQGGDGSGCACLQNNGETQTFTFPMPTWTIQPGSIANGPDNPNCGDPDMIPIVSVGIDSWTNVVDSYTGNPPTMYRPVVSVDPRTGSGDATFTVRAVRPGDRSIQVIWNYDLSMSPGSNCPSHFTKMGPIVDVCVWRYAMIAFPETKGCPKLYPNDRAPMFGHTPDPVLADTLMSLPVCTGRGNCNKWRIAGGAYLDLSPGYYATTLFVWGTNCQQGVGSWVPRTTQAIERTQEHEMKHCSAARQDIQEINDTIVKPALVKVFSTQQLCDDEITALRGKISTEWATRYKNNQLHFHHVGDSKYENDACGNEYYLRDYVAGDP